MIIRSAGKMCIRDRFKIMQKKLDALNSNIQEMLTNVRVIKSFVRGDYEEKKFAASNEDLKQTSLGAFKTIIIVMPLMMLMMNGTTLAVDVYKRQVMQISNYDMHVIVDNYVEMGDFF